MWTWENNRWVWIPSPDGNFRFICYSMLQRAGEVLVMTPKESENVIRSHIVIFSVEIIMVFEFWLHILGGSRNSHWHLRRIYRRKVHEGNDFELKKEEHVPKCLRIVLLRNQIFEIFFFLKYFEGGTSQCVYYHNVVWTKGLFRMLEPDREICGASSIKCNKFHFLLSTFLLQVFSNLSFTMNGD